MRMRFSHGGLLLACMALMACAQTPRTPRARQQPGVWRYGYTLLEDPANVTSDIANCLYTSLDPDCMDEMKGVLRFSLTEHPLYGVEKLAAIFDRKNRRVVYRVDAAGSTDKETIVHEVMHWAYQSRRMRNRDGFRADLARFLEEFGDHPTIARLAQCWEAVLHVRGAAAAGDYFDEHYALIGGLLAAQGFDTGQALPAVVPDYVWRHYRRILSPSARRWRKPQGEEVDLALGDVIAPVTSVISHRLSLSPDEFAALSRYGGIIRPVIGSDGQDQECASSIIDRLAPSWRSVLRLATGNRYVRRMQPASIELRVKIPADQAAMWQNMPSAERPRLVGRLSDETGDTCFTFNADTVDRITTVVESGQATHWVHVRLPGKAADEVRALFAVFFEGGLAFTWTASP